MLQLTILRRALEAGIRPQTVFIEIIPMSLSAGHGAAVEEAKLAPARLTAWEVEKLRGYYAEPYRLYRWCTARLFPIDRFQAELRDALAIDVPDARVRDGDGYGWCPGLAGASPQEVEGYTRATLQSYASAMTQPALAPGPLRALRDLLILCRREQIGVVLLVPPEGSAFRDYAPAVAEIHMNAVRALARELAVPLVDAHAWVDDVGFWDGHHMNPVGADQYTERFGREVLTLFGPSRGAGTTTARLQVGDAGIYRAYH
jgi:hypothetical protein